MEIVEFEKEMAAGVARCYNELVAPVPYSEPVGSEWFSDLKHLARAPLREESLLAARGDSGEIVGFVHVGVAPPATEEWHVKGEPGIIRFLAYRPGERPVGKALLDSAEGWLRQRERSEVIAGHYNYMYPFYSLPCGHISERMSHVPPLFGMAGYSVCESEVIFEWPDFEPPRVRRPEFEVEVTAGKEEIGTSGAGVAVRAKQGEQEIGECVMAWLGSDPRRPELSDWCSCSSIHVNEPHQGKGLGKYLLARGLAEMRKAGARHAMISTDWNNWRAYLFYTNFGFRFLDRTFGFRKMLGEVTAGAR